MSEDEQQPGRTDERALRQHAEQQRGDTFAVDPKETADDDTHELRPETKDELAGTDPAGAEISPSAWTHP